MQPKVVALGGGHGLSATLSSLRSITPNITAIVTVADNGGSSGRLRKEFPEKYESYVDLESGAWTKIRVEV